MGDDDLRANSALQKYDKYSFEYERRFITTIGVFSAAGLAFCFSSSRFADDTERFLVALLPTLWAFLFALVLSGAVPLMKSIQYRKVRNSVYSSEQANLARRGSSLTFANGRSSEEQEKFLSNCSDKDFKSYQLWLRLSNYALIVAVSSLVFALAYPLILLTSRG